MPPFNIIILYHIIINMGMLAAGIEPTKPQQAKKGADCTPLFNIFFVMFWKFENSFSSYVLWFR